MKKRNIEIVHCWNCQIRLSLDQLALKCSNCQHLFCDLCSDRTSKCPTCGEKLKRAFVFNAEIYGESGDEVAKVVKELSSMHPEISIRKNAPLTKLKEAFVTETVKTIFVILGSIIVAILLFWFGLN